MNTLVASRHSQRLQSALPPVPALFERLRAVLSEPEASAAEVARVIEGDPAIAARVLRASNSARYAPASEVCSIRQAVMLMGVSAVGNVLLEAGLTRAFAHLSDDFDLDGFFGHAVRTATSCRELAALSQARCVDPEQAYATGLLHDVGQIALANADPTTYGEVLDASGGDEEILLEVEREAFGLDHAAYGSWILRQWRLPESIAVAVERHHHVELLAEVAPLERLVRMHDRFDEAWMSGGAEQALETRENELMLLLDVPPDVFARHLEERVAFADLYTGSHGDLRSKAALFSGGELC
ncbi:MAG: HDOD domain-containing protein [Planctomycetes bacterium]|nr:HDOD domain-containing protein [Planctomycetota bacterium]